MRVRIGRFYSGAPEAIGVHAELDIPLLVESGAFIQAASGYGKTTLLVEVVEVTHPHIQQIIIDPEGEFSALRANHDFVIVNATKNGDALAHPRTAGLLATRLLETKASAVLDIYDLKPRERHEFVRNFIDSLMNAPKDLWHPVLVILDEAHLFCPEKGFGESEATDAVIDLAGRGRKRGFRLVAATQRIAKFNKNAAAELHTKFIGYAGIDMDVKRAAFELGMQPRDALTQLRKLKSGEFYAYGPALHVLEPCLFRGELPRTKLPKAGHRKLVAPPKPTDKIRALLPQLADLPREVEQKAKTEADLRKDLAEASVRIKKLEAEQRTAFLRTPKSDPPEKMREAIATNKRLRAALDRLMKFFVTLNTTTVTIEQAALDAALASAVQRAQDTIKAQVERQQRELLKVQERGKQLIEDIERLLKEDVSIEVDVLDPVEINLVKREVKPGPPLNYKIVEELVTDSLGEIPGPQQKVLDAIAWMEKATGSLRVTQTAAAFIAGYTPGSSSFRNPRSALAAAGYIRYVDSDVELTAQGREQAAWVVEAPSAIKIQEKVLDLLDGPPRKLLEILLAKYPGSMSQEQHAIDAGYTPGSSSYRNPRSKLSALGLLRYEGDSVYAEKWLFLE